MSVTAVPPAQGDQVWVVTGPCVAVTAVDGQPSNVRQKPVEAAEER